MKIAAGFRMAVALTLVAGTIVAASCATELDLGPIPSYEAALPEGAARPFIVYGDSRRRLTSEFWRGDNNAGRQAIVQALADERPAFIFNTGDLVMAGSERAEWRWFHEQNRPIFERQIPYFAGLGNHEYMWKSRQGMENFFAYFPQLKGRLWYEIRYPPALCLVLDSKTTRSRPRTGGCPRSSPPPSGTPPSTTSSSGFTTLPSRTAFPIATRARSRSISSPA
jgi:hypothetical protein